MDKVASVQHYDKQRGVSIGAFLLEKSFTAMYKLLLLVNQISLLSINLCGSCI